MARLPDLVVRLDPMAARKIAQLVERLERDCKQKETKMNKKRWMWDGQEMGEHGPTELSERRRLSCIVGGYSKLDVYGWTRDELYANARKAGCVEVIEPVRCVCGGETLIRSTVWVPGLPWHVDCQACHMQGPAKNTKEQAVEAWNALMSKVKEVK